MPPKIQYTRTKTEFLQQFSQTGLLHACYQHFKRQHGKEERVRYPPSSTLKMSIWSAGKAGWWWLNFIEVEWSNGSNPVLNIPYPLPPAT
jgi:hypothetical protein